MFIPRLSVPDTGNKFFTRVAGGGLVPNGVVVGQNASGNPLWSNSVLPNCVGECWGRWVEIFSQNGYPVSDIKLTKGSAYHWWQYNDGYSRGQTPKLGAIACYGNESTGSIDGHYHVRVVESIQGNTVVLSNSAWHTSSYYYLTTITNGNYQQGVSSTQPFMGFIYLPFDPNGDLPIYLDDEYYHRKRRRG